MKRYPRALPLVILVTLLAGCAGASKTATARATPTPTISPMPTATATLNPTPLTMAQAWGNVPIAHFSVSFGNLTFGPDTETIESGITDDDQLCGREFLLLPNGSPPQQHLPQAILALFNLHTGDLTVLRTLPPDFQMLSCTVTGPWVIWTQNYGNTPESLQAIWQIMALNRQTGEVRMLDDGKMPNGQMSPKGVYSFPSSGHGLVAYESYLDNQGDSGAVVYDFATGQKTSIGINASFPIISWPWLCWGDPTIPGLIFKNMTTQQQYTLTITPDDTMINASGVLVTPSDRMSVQYYPSIGPNMASTGITLDQATSQNERMGGLGLNARLVGWETVDPFKAVVLDRKLNREVLITSTNVTSGTSPWVVGHYLIWGVHDPHDNSKFIMNVIDTNALP